MVQPDQGLWVHQADRSAIRTCSSISRRSSALGSPRSTKIKSSNTTWWKIAARLPRKTSRFPELRHDARTKQAFDPRPSAGGFYSVPVFWPTDLASFALLIRQKSINGGPNQPDAGTRCDRLADVAVEPHLAARRPAAAQRDRCGARPPGCARTASRACRRRSPTTAPCIRIGPASVSGMTKCTVAPEIFTPARSAWPCGSSPGNDGSSEGWILSIRPYQRCTNSAVNSRMKPARQISSIRCWSSAACSTASKAARSLPNGLLSITSGRDARGRWPFRARPHPRGWKSRPRSRPENPPQPRPRSSAAMFDPRPEIRIATRRFMASPSRDRDGRCRSRGARLRPGSPRRAMRRSRPLAAKISLTSSIASGLTIAIMPMPQLKVRSNSSSAMPPCSASHLNTGSTGSRARSMPTPRCLGSTRGMLSVKPPPVMWASPLTAAGLADRAQAGFDIEPRRREQRAAQRHDRRERRRRVERETRLSRRSCAPARIRWNGRRTKPDRSPRRPPRYRRAAAACRARPRRPQSPPRS